MTRLARGLSSRSGEKKRERRSVRMRPRTGGSDIVECALSPAAEGPGVREQCTAAIWDNSPWLATRVQPSRDCVAEKCRSLG